jgi:hypothetical protein
MPSQSLPSFPGRQAMRGRYIAQLCSEQTAMVAHAGEGGGRPARAAAPRPRRGSYCSCECKYILLFEISSLRLRDLWPEGWAQVNDGISGRTLRTHAFRISSARMVFPLRHRGTWASLGDWSAVNSPRATLSVSSFGLERWKLCRTSMNCYYAGNL